MAGLKYKASDGTYKPLTVYNVTTPDVVQTTGTEEGSEKAVMSQSAVTTEFQKYVTKTSFNETISGYSTTGEVETVKNTLNTHTGNTDIHVNSEQVAAIAAVSSKANISDLTTHTANAEIHVTAEDKEKWNAVSGKAESNNVYTKAEVDSAVALKANSADLTAHTADSTVHITADERNAWNAKADADDVYTKTEADDKFQAVGDYVSSTTLSNYSTTEQMNSAISSAVAPKANSADVYTKGEVDSAVSVKANAADVYTKAETYTKDEADNKFQAVGNYVSSTTLNDYSTTSQVDAKISAATSGKADSSTVTSLNNSLTGHTTNGTIHITADERSKWNAKAEVSDIKTKVSQLINDKNFISYAKYDDAAKKINFYADSASTATSVVSIDATAFVKDGMVNSASVSGSNLVITFNTDAGKDNIAIPISSIFNANNYYTTANTYSKTEVDNELAGKSNTGHTHAISEVTGLQSALDGKSPTSHTHVISGVTGLQAALDGKSNTGHKHTISDVTNLQSALDGKSGTGHTHNYAGSASAGGAATTANKVANALTLKLNGASAQTYNGSSAIEFNVTPSGIGAAASSHSHNYAGAGSAGGAANSAVTLTTATAGSATQPVYFTGGKPAACTYTLEKSVPSNAVFTDTDTHHVSNTIVASASTATANTSASNGSVYLNHIENGSVRNAHKIVGGGATTVTSDTAGTITVSSTNTTYSAGSGIGLSNTQFYNSGVRSISTGTANGTINVNTNGSTANVAVYGLGSAAYTNSNAYAAASHNHNYAGSSSAGGVANSAATLTTNAGSATQPVYFTGGKPAACTYTLGKSVPSDAVFTDTNTHYASNTIVASAANATSNGAASNGNVYLNHIENGSVRNAHKIVGGGATTVTSDTAGTITISSTNTTYGTATTSSNGLMSSSDKSKLDGIQAGADTVSFSRSLSSGTKIGTLTINGTGTDLYCQTNTDTNTTYSAGAGIGLNGTQFYNTGVRSISSGSTNGTISVNTNGTAADVAVKGLGSAAYTNSNAYAAASHSHNYAGSSSAGGAANSAVTLTTNAGSATQPVYFTGGKPAACSYTLGKSVPADAVFTDTNTTYSAGSGIGLTGTQFYNSGVRAIGTGTANGTISVNTNGSTANVSVYGLRSAAYTNSGDYATASHSHTPASIGALPTAAQQFSAVSTTTSIANATCPFSFGADGQNGTVMYYNSGSANVTITVSTNYKTPTKEQLNITIVPGGYGEVNYLRFNGSMIVARGL